ncbi:FkbM family methyltransferase [Vulcanococcus limneticus Candia 3F8]|uniref:FkbM family methyltransferase n=1 Tax=Vulcanococcus limneticus TaxID=2170428 RepID=UPI0020CC9AFD|nr:FkbM family methyltransferase [Vulcanococcus limneticus]MCP9894784.1 FkbM family methyltransferase [Vulcanococcus limneticus Candia 3F8]
MNHPLWHERRGHPFIRFARLQLIFALGEQRVYLKWIGKLMLPIEKGDTGLTGNYYLGLDEFEDMSFAIHLLRQDDIFIDVGSNLGSYSLLASGVAKANSFAIEPVPATYDRLIQNIGVNFLGNKISAQCLALSTPSNSSNGIKLKFSSDRGCMNSFVDNTYKGSTISVDVSTLDKECKDLEPALIKIDVEGFEEDVLKGASETLAKSSLLAVIIEGQTENVNQLFRDAGFIDVNYLPLRAPRIISKSQRF